MRRVTVVVNPISGSARRGKAVESFTETLRASGAHVRVRPTESAGHGATIAREEADDDVDVVVAAGGDGTANEVARGLLDAPGDTALGLLPLGTANLLARDLGVPFDPTQAAITVLDGKTAPYDVADADGRTFLCCLGVGFDAHVVHALSTARRGHIGFASYAGPILRAFRGYSFPRFQVTAEDGTEESAVMALFLNGRSYAGFFVPSPGARADDGLLDAVLMLHGGRRDLARWIVHARRGTLPDARGVRLVRSASFRVDAAEPLPYQVDGDVGAETPVAILTRPAALRVVRPVSVAQGGSPS